MTYGKKRDERMETYARSYLATLGLALAVLGCFGLSQYDAMNGDWAPFAVAFLVACTLGGLAMILVGLFGSDRTVDGWADATSSHDAALIVVVIAFPFYLVLRPFYKRR
ncbi:hypothetical protein BZL54_04640 [Burkholderia ubonensis subsp. mesacidophila]|uniref:Uncharacterized protein n=2 Tax=Burkholderia ubonensis TaxID=101571 RepID=A0A2A4FKC2_9BURK|nr:hypothetical protein BZL54_04640 [Burkholderia ubonensis subsp. mesacidophila]